MRPRGRAGPSPEDPDLAERMAVQAAHEAVERFSAKAHVGLIDGCAQRAGRVQRQTVGRGMDMICIRGIVRGIVTLAVLLGLGSLSPALAQKTTLPPAAYAFSNRSSVYTQQLRMASELGHRALAELKRAPTDEGVPLDESVVQPARDTYVLIRAA
jgi:hypothetical protein